MVRTLLIRITVTGLAVLASCAPALHLSPTPQGFVAMPVRSFHLNQVALGPFHTTRMRSPTGFRIWTGLDLGFIRLFNRTAQRQRINFSLANAQGEVAQTQALNHLIVHSSIGDLGHLPDAGPNTPNWYSRKNADVFKGTITLPNRDSTGQWQFEIENAHQLKGPHIEGQVTDGKRLIRLLSVERATDFGRDGHLDEALLAAQVKRGLVFRYENRLIGALDQTYPDYPIFFIRPELDPTLQFVLANSAVLLLRHANLLR
ncbi:hypothetical protein [Hymenobacter wooponensis]|uniref:Uncharacterized protein n=1 Tax=Hymenobacter wooponensis TaxID=1525360 RepID=A0A4Z0MLF6_9BACT|nr:hypothetical protein [Hymenobacter wooponensis]TGD80220.1 hypothetical protein EU557_10250 [Hymenobacter wooponensis]